MSRFLFDDDVRFESDKWEDRRNLAKSLSRANITVDTSNIPNNLEEAEELLDKLEDEYNEITKNEIHRELHKHAISEHALAVLERIAELVEMHNDKTVQQTMNDIETGTYIEEDPDEHAITDQIEEENWKHRRRIAGYDDNDDGDSFEDIYTDD